MFRTSSLLQFISPVAIVLTLTGATYAVGGIVEVETFYGYGAGSTIHEAISEAKRDVTDKAQFHEDMMRTYGDLEVITVIHGDDHLYSLEYDEDEQSYYATYTRDDTYLLTYFGGWTTGQMTLDFLEFQFVLLLHPHLSNDEVIDTLYDVGAL